MEIYVYKTRLEYSEWKLYDVLLLDYIYNFHKIVKKLFDKIVEYGIFVSNWGDNYDKKNRNKWSDNNS